jgi:2,3-bisphosphoglycerate-dependent phosphoglycerate mutase
LIEIVFETHSTSDDNERGAASGWNHSRLSVIGRRQAVDLGLRRRTDRIDVVFSSDLKRAVETTEIAFAGTAVPILLDWRLRECDYGERNGGPVEAHHRDRAEFVDRPYPGGESWSQAVARVARVLDDVVLRWDDKRVLIVGHVATRWALDHCLNGISLTTLATADFAWQEGWEYSLSI